MTIETTIEEDLKWREAELASLTRLAITANDTQVTKPALLRALWALLYAHFEGFTKFCWDTVLDHVQSTSIPTAQLDLKFALLALESTFKDHRAKHLDSNSIWIFFDQRLPQALSEIAIFPESARLKTESNLWPNIFERESARLGIECEELKNHRARIKALVSRRNDIAHGKKMVIATLDDYLEYEKATLLILHELALKSIQIVNDEAYKQAGRP